MTRNKIVHYFKLTEDFFNSLTAMKIVSIENGDRALLIYLRLLSQAVRNKGYIALSGILEPREEIAVMMRENPETVNELFDFLEKAGLVETKDNTIFFYDAAAMSGKETGAAGELRTKRLKEAGKENPNPTEVIKDDISRKSSSVKEKNDTDDKIEKIAELWNSLPDNIPKIRTISKSSERYRKVKTRLRNEGYDTVVEAINKISESQFLSGKKTDFVITFDWLMKPSNMAKVLEDNYKDRKNPKEKPAFEDDVFMQVATGKSRPQDYFRDEVDESDRMDDDFIVDLPLRPEYITQKEQNNQ